MSHSLHTAASGARTRVFELATLAAIGTPAEAEAARSDIMSISMARGAWPASIQGLYQARGRGEVGGFTLPAVNIRGLTFDTARALFRAMSTTDGIAIFELNRAEVAFTAQEPAEFAALVMAAAVTESYEGPVFIQADHMQANARAFAADSSAESAALEELIRKAVAAGFYNIDIDASTLVDLSFERVADQQRPNAELTARLFRLVRRIEPAGTTISIGGEIGEVGAHNSTAEELVTYIDQVRALTGRDAAGLSKVSVQTGTTHGGIALPDGTVAEVALDFETLEQLSRLARERFGMAGAVQHGASTLPESLFGRFPDAECAEVHLATGFQNLVFDHPAFPPMLAQRLNEHCLAAFASERLEGETDAQFLYKVRKKAWGPFKPDLLALPDDTRAAMGVTLRARFEFLIRQLRADGTRALVDRYVARAR